MNKAKLMVVLMAAALVVSFGMATGDVAKPAGKPAGVKITPLSGPISEINASGTPAAKKDPADFCDNMWQGPAAFYIGGYLVGDEYYAAYQDPVETGCPTPVYPFGVTAVVWHAYAQDSVTFDIQPLVYDCPGPDEIGSALCAGPLYNVHLPNAGGWIITIPFGDTCCVYGPYYAGIYVTGTALQNRLEIVTDDGITVPVRSDATYNDKGNGWLDLVDDEGFTWNLRLWSEGYNSDQNNCPLEEPLVIFPGVDLFETPNDGMTVESLFTSTPIPADFFGPGSDPFDGIIALQGSPLTTVPPGILGPTDVIINRTLPADFIELDSVDTIPIELVALSLVSTNPITVTYNGGQNPEDWQVDICLSSVFPPPYPGTMAITRQCDSGGSFIADIYEVYMKVTFTQVNPTGGGSVVYDPYRADYRLIRDGRWSTYVPPPFSLYTSPGQVLVDDDCNPQTPEVLIGASSGNFYPGITLEPCPPGPPICGGKVLTLLDGPYIDHRMLPPQMTSPAVGACCLADDRCVLVDAVCCGNLAGTYKGDYTRCFPDPCVTCCNHDGIRGDVDQSNSINVADDDYIVQYLFFSGPPPPCQDPDGSYPEADMDASGGVNVADEDYLIQYLFFSGPAPAPCP